MSQLLVAQRALTVPGWAKDALWRRAQAIPSLDLRFADSKSLVDATTGSSLVTFTRASSGTFVGSDGVIQTAVTNLLLRSEEFQTTWSPTRASITVDAAVAPNGTVTADKLAEDSTAANTHTLQQAFSFIGGITYTASVYVKAAERIYFNLELGGSGVFGTATSATFSLLDGSVFASSNSPVTSATSIGNGWWRFSVSKTATSSAGSNVIFYLANDSGSRVYTGDGTSGLFIWGAQLEQSSSVGEYIPTTSTINSAPRFDHNPTTGESLGLLVEEQRANLLLHNRTLTNAAWVVSNITAAKDQVGADGVSNSASSITASAGNGTILQTITSASAARATSAYVKRITGTGTIEMTQDNGTTWTAVTVTSAWTRVTIPSATVTNPVVGFRIVTSGDAIAVDYAQCESGAFSTSAIETTAATVTRSADVASDTTRGGNIRSLFAQFRSPASGTRPVVSLDDNTANERIEILTSGTDPKLLVTDGGSAVADLDAGTVSANTTARIAARLNTDDYAISINGGTSQLDTSGTLPTVNRIRIGSNQAGGYLNGTIARITGWDTVLPNLPPVTQ